MGADGHHAAMHIGKWRVVVLFVCELTLLWFKCADSGGKICTALFALLVAVDVDKSGK